MLYLRRFTRHAGFLSFCLLTSLSCFNVCAGEESEPEVSSQERFGPPVRTTYKPIAGLGKIDINIGGNICFHTPESVTLWRTPEQAGQGVKVQLRNASTNDSIKLLWPAGQTSLAWPVSKLPMVDGTSYLLKMAHIAETIVLYQMPETLQNNVEQLAWLNQQGCHLAEAE